MLELYIKYLLEGIAVAVAAYYIPRRQVDMTEIMFIALSAAATFAILDIFAPSVGSGARKGAGFGIGATTVGWPRMGMEGFEDKKAAAAAHKKDMAHHDDGDASATESSEETETEDKEGFDASSEGTMPHAKKTHHNNNNHAAVQGYDNNQAYSTF
jgi:hypothetical protein